MWGTCMAINVYLCLFLRWDSARLKQNFIWYISICYGVPWIPAFFCLWYRTKNRGRVYGNATVGDLPLIDLRLAYKLLSIGAGSTMTGKSCASTPSMVLSGVTSSLPS